MKAPVVMTRIESPVGPLVVAGTDEGVCMLEFEGRRADVAGVAERLGRPVVDGEGRMLPGPVGLLLAELSAYFAGTLREFTVPLVTLAMAGVGIAMRARAMLPGTAALDRLMPVKLPPDTSKLLLCPMPGMVVSIAVTEGQEVKAGETLAVVEAMKMENVLRADRDLTVSRINAKPGESLAVDAVIMEFA